MKIVNLTIKYIVNEIEQRDMVKFVRIKSIIKEAGLTPASFNVCFCSLSHSNVKHSSAWEPPLPSTL